MNIKDMGDEKYQGDVTALMAHTLLRQNTLIIECICALLPHELADRKLEEWNALADEHNAASKELMGELTKRRRHK